VTLPEDKSLQLTSGGDCSFAARFMSVVQRVLVAMFAWAILGFLGLQLLLSRTWEFRVQAGRGQPIVQAIERFKKQTGSYPSALADLVPKYLENAPDISDLPNRKFRGWNYRVLTNGVTVSYSLKYYMGRGGVEYEPPVWLGNSEGRRTVLWSN
jgi:hypothetical protein